MSARKTLTVREVGQMFGLELPDPGSGKRSRSKCPFRQHKRRDPTFRVFPARADGKCLWKCWSCDPPDNVGDAVTLYARLASIDRKAAWKKLLGDGWAVPGARDDYEGRGEGGGPTKAELERRAYEKEQRDTIHTIPVTGVRPDKILPLPRERWERWAARRTGGLERFAEKRGMSADFLREHGVIDMGGPFVGFTYFDPSNGQPCRVKVRGIEEKRFWVEPRPPEDDHSGARANDVLYLAHELLRVSRREPIILTEGEPDALAVRSTGLMNVLSLPDGNESAKTADLSPIHGRYSTWFVAMDNDKPGDDAAEVLRARSWGMTVLRVKWCRIVAGELEYYKDANAALLAGFQREDFIRCLEMAAKDKFVQVDWRIAS